jgi:hypothetical protein
MGDKKHFAQIRKIAARNGYEAWLRYDDTADVYEAFASSDGDDYIGCFDTTSEAERYARRWIAERINEAA